MYDVRRVDEGSLESGVFLPPVFPVHGGTALVGFQQTLVVNARRFCSRADRTCCRFPLYA